VLVKVAALRVGLSDFDKYALLGDDIVIADTSVANSYLYIMEQLGVDISKPKSLVSPVGLFEFAKRICGPLEEFSPLGPANLVLALRNSSRLPALFSDALEKG